MGRSIGGRSGSGGMARTMMLIVALLSRGATAAESPPLEAVFSCSLTTRMSPGGAKLVGGLKYSRGRGAGGGLPALVSHWACSLVKAAPG
jgi:hypothetical protein